MYLFAINGLVFKKDHSLGALQYLGYRFLLQVSETSTQTSVTLKIMNTDQGGQIPQMSG